jgi:type III secretion protein U
MKGLPVLRPASEKRRGLGAIFMADESSEEKTLPATDKKLKDSRKKGKVSQSRDLVNAGALLAVIGYLFIIFPNVRDRIFHLFDAVSRASGGAGSAELMPSISTEVQHAWLVLLYFFVPLVIILVLTVVITGIIGTLGPVFSFENVKFDFNHINPAKGLERLFSLRNFVGFVESVVKVVVLAAAFWLVLRMWIQAFFQIPACGRDCPVPILLAALKPLAATAIIAFLIIGFLDALIQRRLFLRDMRMTKTEFKRELKDLEGDPLIQGERRRIRYRLFSEPPSGLRQAAFVLTGGNRIVALRYDGEEFIVPVVAFKAGGEQFETGFARASMLGVPFVENAALTGAIFERVQMGMRISREFYDPIIRILHDLKLLKS